MGVASTIYTATLIPDAIFIPPDGANRKHLLKEIGLVNAVFTVIARVLQFTALHS